ncbi:hypothetical protein [Vulgatibacter incomptus]|uniref:Lipoprotein n=1 Tax=Vulgatibacter incomptus TaxID=1391653 RepID=A0A0K1PEV6_9BACT|nr:hypothetical protein [Vulgatibacter incomptus]AKU92050.1 hypothetical protein AKJ08_2437 [Vulgatibacter incomptus]
MIERALLGFALVLALGGCGRESKDDGDPLTQGERCVLVQEQAEACVESFCASGKASAFCGCYDQGLDLDTRTCTCGLVDFWKARKTELCPEDLPNNPRLDCASMNLAQYEACR